MPKINFYLLTQNGENARRLFACRLAEKLFRQGRPVQIYTSLEEEAAQLDQLLWSFTPESFVPHQLAGSAPLSGPRVLISWGSHLEANGTLLNLGDTIPPAPEDFAVIAEFVLNEESAKAHGRDLWNRYKQQGYELQHHQM